MSAADLFIREIQPPDAAAWCARRATLWPCDHEREVAGFFAGARTACEMVFVIDRGDGEIAGFIELSKRGVAEGCSTSPVAYVEGWYVDDDLRRTGMGKQLMETAESWARAEGLEEIASDCEIDNELSLKAHLGLGFDEEVRIICFHKAL